VVYSLIIFPILTFKLLSSMGVNKVSRSLEGAIEVLGARHMIRPHLIGQRISVMWYSIYLIRCFGVYYRCILLRVVP